MLNLDVSPSALFNPETIILIQKRHPYTGNLHTDDLHRETSGDVKKAFLNPETVVEDVNSVA